jgi:hypothetical protein
MSCNPWLLAPNFPAPLLVVPDCPSAGRIESEVDDIVCEPDAPVDDLCCYITFSTPAEAVLGMGLFRHPETSQQYWSYLAPDFDMVGDYVSADAFNEGITRASAADNGRSRAWYEYPSFTSSARRRINCWLPLYINAQHWADAKRYLPSSLVQLVALYDDDGSVEAMPELNASNMLDVFCSLLTSAVVGFTVGQSESSISRLASRGKASERSLQMYVDVHRVFLQVAKEYPEIEELALRRLQDFIAYPSARTREKTPDLGRLAHCLLVVDEVTWEDLAPALLPEALRRHAVRQRSRGRHFDPQQCGSDLKDLLAAWDRFAAPVGLVISFCVMFCKLVGRPKGCTIADVKSEYDQRWGRLSDAKKSSILFFCADLAKCQSLALILEMLYPSRFGRDNLEQVCELILWAERFGRRREMGAIPAAKWPSLEQNSYRMVSGWRKQWDRIRQCHLRSCAQACYRPHVQHIGYWVPRGSYGEVHYDYWYDWC